MSRHESTGMTAAELAQALRELRAEPSEEFAQALDARAAQGFRRERRGRRTRRRILRSPALVAAALLVVLAAVAVPLALSSHAHRAPGATEADGGAAALSGSAAGTARRHASKPTSGSISVPAVTASEAPAQSSAAGGSAAASGAGAAARRVERTATLELGVAGSAIQSAAQRVFSLVSAFGGYVRESSVSSGPGSAQGSGSAQGGATFDVRVPSGNLSGAIAALSHLGHVRSETNTTNDVTEQLGSLQRSLGDERAQRSSLLKQIASASEEARAAELRGRLRAVEARIAHLEGSLRALRSRIDYTSLALSIAPENGAGASTGSSDLTPTGAARDAAQILDAAIAIVVLAAAALLPLGIVLAALWWIAMLGRRRMREHALDAS